MAEIVAHVTRNGRVESIHRGHIAICRPDSTLLASVGNPMQETYMRSAAKPFQIMPLLLAPKAQEFGLTNKEWAVMIASHNGESKHIAAVESILRKVGLKLDDLRCGIHPPLHSPTAKTMLRTGDDPTVLHNNCSGKHAGMLMLAKINDWPLATYLQPDHPVQERIKERMALFSGLGTGAIGVGIDGCSAPVFFLPLQNMARMFAWLAERRVEPSRRVFELMSENPEMIAGSERLDTALMQATNGRLVSKVGAEGIRCVGVSEPEPLGVAVKIEDGALRVSGAVLLAVLAQLELLTRSELDKLVPYTATKLKNHAGIEVGEVSMSFVIHS